MKLENTSDADAMTLRREAVASLRLRGLTLREIALALAKQGIVYKEGEPYSAQTIKTDLDALRKEWKKNAAVTTETHIARQMAEIGELKRAAWGKSRYEAVLRAIEMEMKLLGTNKPERLELTGKDGKDFRIDVRYMTDEQLEQLANSGGGGA